MWSVELRIHRWCFAHELAFTGELFGALPCLAAPTGWARRNGALKLKFSGYLNSLACYNVSSG